MLSICAVVKELQLSTLPPFKEYKKITTLQKNQRRILHKSGGDQTRKGRHIALLQLDGW